MHPPSILAIFDSGICEHLLRSAILVTMTDFGGARIIDEMRRLVNKYPGGFEGWEQSQQQATGRSGSEHPPQVGSGVYGKNSRNF